MPPAPDFNGQETLDGEGVRTVEESVVRPDGGRAELIRTVQADGSVKELYTYDGQDGTVNRTIGGVLSGALGIAAVIGGVDLEDLQVVALGGLAWPSSGVGVTRLTVQVGGVSTTCSPLKVLLTLSSMM